MILSDEYETVDPGCGCGPFAVLATTFRRWRRTGEWWHCPHCGSRRHFIGETEEQRRIRQLEQRVAREQGRVIEERTRADSHRRRYRRMRERIQNGLCPCCNRSFTNLARHMATKHPDMKGPEKLRHLRYQYGMTQADLAQELGLGGPSAVSHYETGRSVGGWRLERIEGWLDEQLAV